MTVPDTARLPALRHPLLAELHTAADALVEAVHATSRVGVEIALDQARCAAAVSDDASVAEHVVWVAAPSRYRRLRDTGMPPSTACALIADDLHRQEPPRA